MRAKLVVASFAVGAVLLAVTCAQAGKKDPAAKCQEAKAKAAGQKAAALLKAMGKNISKFPDPKLAANIAKAQSKFTKAFTKAESKGGCEGTGNTSAVEVLTDDFVSSVIWQLGHFVDNGDGTITDTGRALMWEKKDNAGGLHDVDNKYSWAGCCDGNCNQLTGQLCQPNAAAAAACSAQTSGAVGCSECSSGTCHVDQGSWGAITTIWDWLVQVNGEGGNGFAGHSDWRIPSEDGCNACWTDDATRCSCGPAELESILWEPYPCGAHPCIDGIFGPTAAAWYWSSATFAPTPFEAWSISFYAGDVSFLINKFSGDSYVRAVRDIP